MLGLLVPTVGAVIAASIYGEIAITYINWWVIANTRCVWVVIIGLAKDDLHKGNHIGSRNVFVTIHIGGRLIIFTWLISKDIH